MMRWINMFRLIGWVLFCANVSLAFFYHGSHLENAANAFMAGILLVFLFPWRES